jgi:16S rRNA (guanine527-N7)-methyltransferase
VSILGGRVESVYRYELPGGAGERAIVVIVKEGLTPGSYPRRAGAPTRRPL